MIASSRRQLELIRAVPFAPAASWTYKIDSDKKEEHDFHNLLFEFESAVQRDDRSLMDYCRGEMARMYGERNHGRRKKRS